MSIDKVTRSGAGNVLMDRDDPFVTVSMEIDRWRIEDDLGISPIALEIWIAVS